MKITDMQHGQVPGSVTGKSTQRSGEVRFQEIMEQVARKEHAGGPGIPGAAGAPVPDGVQIVTGPEKVQGAGSGGPKEMLLAEISETLDLIDHYATGLGNKALSPAEMKPLVEHLEGRLEGLRHMETDEELPETLRSVVSDLVITIGTEVAKFGRGDYE
ncbi:MAG: hypothetical protein K9M82_05675 [Deltaproteobacteria bacterium]|nr:hypothetical protein [Deltaproteobacteria bacterium]